jgi:hypothetical protein
MSFASACSVGAMLLVLRSPRGQARDPAPTRVLRDEPEREGLVTVEPIEFDGVSSN